VFYFPISHQEVARQIAELLNSHNNLAKQRIAADILRGKTNYVVETHGKLVIGAAGIQKVSHELSELKHIVVEPSWRGKGVGAFLTARALQICETPSVYATVRTTNEASARTLLKAGFCKSHTRQAGDYQLAMFVRASPKCQPKNTRSKLL
jgi:N-acetylglutamate synthase-like GNAT family acetyltransferase